MPEPVQSSTETPPAASTTTTPPASEEVDVTKLSAEQLSKVLENKELWKNPRLAGLLESDKQLKQLKKDQDTLKEKTLAEQKKFEELATKRGADLESSNKRIQELQANQTLTNLLVKENVVDLDGALKLVDRSKISVDENGQVTGADEALTSLKTDKAYLFNNASGTPSVGTPSNPSGSQSGQPGRYKFKESQLTPTFYKEHAKEINEAASQGLIEADGAPPAQF